MINNNYLEGLAKLMTNQSYNLSSYVAFGSTTGTLSASDTETSGEFDRIALTSSSNTGAIAKYTTTRSSVDAYGESINVVSLVNTSTLLGTGDIQANSLVASLVHTTDFDVGIEFWVSHTRG